MLKDMLKIIRRDGYISRPSLARELNVSEASIDDGIAQLLRMGYLAEEKTGVDCATSCAKCAFAKNCSKEVVKAFKLSGKGGQDLI